MQYICIAWNLVVWVGSLHGRELLHHVHDEVVGDLLQMLQNLDGALDEVGLVVLDAPLLAEGLDKLVALLQVVSWHHGEEMVIYLVLEAATKPIHEELRNAVATSDVPSGCHLKLPEVRSSGSIIYRHSIVSQSEHKSEE